MYNIPILLICFNRPDHVRRVLTEIRQQQPAHLYIAQDGAREGNETDAQKVLEVRAVVDELVDWPCQVHKLFQEQNLGCGPGPVAGLNWFFHEVEMGIVMEDDCLPHPDFFGYCEELLHKYDPKLHSGPKVGYISGALYHTDWRCEGSYGFSHFMVTGAWAAWRETWEGFDIDLRSQNERQLFRQVRKLTQDRQEAYWWLDTLRVIKHETAKKSYWDYQMQIHLFLNEMLTIHPKCNLISNIGFDAEGTHTKGNDGKGDRPIYPILPLVHPTSCKVDLVLDRNCFGKSCTMGWLKDTISNFYFYLLRSRGLGHHMLVLYKRIKGSGYNSRWTN